MISSKEKSPCGILPHDDLLPYPEALCFMVDSTASMGPWIRALTQILPDIIQMTALTGSFQYLSIIQYGDYDSSWRNLPDPVQFSGWLQPGDPALSNCAAAMMPKGGGGHPEAVKTALYTLVNAASSFPDAIQHRVRVLHLTDAGAHIVGNTLDAEGRAEQRKLGKAKFDWVTLTTAHIKPLPISYSCLTTTAFVPYYYLAEATGGAVHHIKGINSLFEDIKAVLNGWFGLLPVGQLTAVHVPVDAGPIPTTAARTEKDFRLQLRWRSQERDVTVPALAACVAHIATRMRSDEAYIAMAIQLLGEITKTSPLVLSSNALFGKLWREFCRRRTDPQRSVLMQQLDRSAAKLSPADREIFDEWGRASYNLADEITQELNEHVMTHGVPGGQVVTFTPDVIQRPCDMLEFARACTAGDQAAVVSVLTRLVVVTHSEYARQPFTAAEMEAHALREEEEGTISLLPPNSLPLNLPLPRLFALLLHLAAPGTALTQRPAAIVALLASRSGCVLAPQANEYLQSIRGHWLTWDKMKIGKSKDKSNDGNNTDVMFTPVVAENFCISFLYLLKSHTAALTDREQAVVLKLLKFAFATRVLKMEVEVETFQEGSMDGVFPDHVRVCDPIKGCGKKRALSLITQDEVCGYCFWDNLEKIPKKEREARAEVPAESTFMVQCAVCSAFYARDRKVQVLGRSQCFVCYQKGYLSHETAIEPRVKKLKSKAGDKGKVGHTIAVKPIKETPAMAAAKASCRDKTHSPYVQCIVCGLNFVTYHGLPGDTCAACVVKPCQRKPVYNTTTITIAKLFWPSGIANINNEATSKRCIDTLFGLLGVRAQGAFDCSIVAATEILMEIPTVIPEAEVFPELQFNGHAVHNSAAVWAQLVNAAQTQTFEHSLCAICCDSFPADQLMLACGRSNCTQRICNGCGEAWYGELTPGKVINMRHLSCPFCVKPPASKTISRWNKAAKGLRGTVVFDPRYFYAWCVGCNHAVEYAPRACGIGGDNDPGPRLNNYSCEPCRVLQEAEAERLRLERERLAEEQMRRELVRLTIAERAAAIRAHREEARAAQLATVARRREKRHVDCQPCPNCTVMVTRISGCNHISCPCGCHFCYECGAGFDDSSACYSHMSRAHGRIYFDEDPMYSDDEDY